jgi:hypothetical protein
MQRLQDRVTIGGSGSAASLADWEKSLDKPSRLRAFLTLPRPLSDLPQCAQFKQADNMKRAIAEYTLIKPDSEEKKVIHSQLRSSYPNSLTLSVLLARSEDSIAMLWCGSQPITLGSLTASLSGKLFINAVRAAGDAITKDKSYYFKLHRSEDCRPCSWFLYL